MERFGCQTSVRVCCTLSTAKSLRLLSVAGKCPVVYIAGRHIPAPRQTLVSMQTEQHQLVLQTNEVRLVDGVILCQMKVGSGGVLIACL